MYNKLSIEEYDNVVAAILEQPFDTKLFGKAVRKINSGSAIRPDFAEHYPSFAWRAKELRINPTQAIEHLVQHQKACDAAFIAYWYILTKPKES